MLSNIGNRMVAQAKLLVNSVKIALIKIAMRMIKFWGAATMKPRKFAMVLDRSDTCKQQKNDWNTG